MKPLNLLIIFTFLIACSDDEKVLPDETIATEANLITLELRQNGVIYPTIIDGINITLSEPLPFGTESVTIAILTISDKATASKSIWEVLQVSDSPISIEVTAEDQLTTKTYWITLETADEPDYADFLFEQFTSEQCAMYATIDVGELRLENNAWNADGLPANSFSQCIYTYQKDDFQLMGWQWQYPDDAYGVNAYPQLIYGWKPWQPASTTENLPQQLSAISQLKVSFDAAITRNEGDYNLAYDIWINASADIQPENILFEFMIWEEAQNLVPFGNFQEVVSTSHGDYRFYMGEPDWEPEGCNWTYLAFQRIENRTSGTVDIDELLDYLIREGIVSETSYLASVEFGNEVGNSTGQTIIKEFTVMLE